MFYSILFIFSDACALRYFGKILLFSNSHFSTNFRRFFDRCTFDELSFDVISTNGRVLRNVVFDDMSHSTKGFSTKSHGRVEIIASLDLFRSTPSAQFYLFMGLFWCTPSTLKIAKSSPPSDILLNSDTSHPALDYRGALRTR